MGRPVTAVVLPGPQHPPKVKYFPVTITTEYDASSEPSSREASRPSSPESGNLSARTVYSPTPEMAIIHRTMHDAIHAVREQQGRAVTRSLLSQQKAIAVSKLQCNIQIKRTSTPEHPPMSNVPPRRARARSERANGVTSSSSEESDCEPQTSRMAQFQALRRLDSFDCRKLAMYMLSNGKKFLLLFCELFFSFIIIYILAVMLQIFTIIR